MVGVLEKLMDYQWPGNVRELQNVAQHAVAFAGTGKAIRVEHLPERLHSGGKVAQNPLSFAQTAL